MPKPSYVANYIPGLIREGHSATSGLRAIRENGLSVADATWYRLWGETQAHLANQEAFVDSPLNRRPSVDQIGIATRPRARGYLYNIQLAVHDPNTGEVSFHAWGYRSNKLVSISTAIAGAIDSYNGAQELNRESLQGRVMGGFTDSVLNLVGPDDSEDLA